MVGSLKTMSLHTNISQAKALEHRSEGRLPIGAPRHTFLQKEDRSAFLHQHNLEDDCDVKHPQPAELLCIAKPELLCSEDQSWPEPSKKVIQQKKSNKINGGSKKQTKNAGEGTEELAIKQELAAPTVRGIAQEDLFSNKDDLELLQPTPSTPQEALQHLISRVTIKNHDLGLLRWCLAELKILVMQISPRWQIKPFGSTVNGFGFRGRDLDATCYYQDASEQTDTCYQELRDVLPQMLLEHPRFVVVEEVSSARIPILKLNFDGALDVDLSFGNMDPLFNTQLLQSYANLHKSVQDLVVCMKIWAKWEGVCGANAGHLSAYSITLMTIYFMQVDSRLQLPCLDVSLFHSMDESPEIKENWSCSKPLLELLSWCFEFYSSVFSWGEEVVCVRSGQRQNISDANFVQLSGRKSYSTLHIEDPFLLHRNLNCVLGQVQEQVLITKLSAAYQALSQGMLPPGLQLALDNCCQTYVDQAVHEDAYGFSQADRSFPNQMRQAFANQVGQSFPNQVGHMFSNHWGTEQAAAVAAQYSQQAMHHRPGVQMMPEYQQVAQPPVFMWHPEQRSGNRHKSQQRGAKEKSNQAAKACEESDLRTVSVGSVGHPHSCADPCKYVMKTRGCKDGERCPRCHLCDFKKLKQKPKLR